MLGDGTKMNMLMEQGNHSKFPVSYSKGRAPEHEGEVALSYLISEESGLYPGDEILVKTDGKYKKYVVSGIYSDITNGGKTAKLFTESFENQENVMWRIAYATLNEDVNKEDFIYRYTACGAEVTDIVNQVQGTYGPTLNQIWKVSILIKMVSSVIILLVVMMFVRMMIVNQRNMISIKKAMGFRSTDIKKSFRKSCVPYILGGIILGTVCSFTLGEVICGVFLKSFGAEGFQFIYNVWSVAINMLIGGVSVILAVCLGIYGIKNIKAVECCRGGE